MEGTAPYIGESGFSVIPMSKKILKERNSFKDDNILITWNLCFDKAHKQGIQLNFETQGKSL